ncbi:P-loop containing nucleoside triphosphate hydrolase protein [Jimgerdemannia flammicorona]|uniref:P-loop containing nucleoside triphosphate hydrolase protein n=1 Tax=Jimgerdemannia flammicorona TaxID=994334 RepID=A0A433B0X5_9FUNG|nr:P-loop containing nucleoside triphosphate hydrolase protein [Jimgerdemannia flammicorona]
MFRIPNSLSDSLYASTDEQLLDLRNRLEASGMADGTCTRCPMELRLKKTAESWSCLIKIRWVYQAENKRFDSVREEAFGEPITDSCDVEDRVRRAQKAVLNPSKSSLTFLHGELAKDEANELKFSRNIVCIEVKGRSCPNLSLMDLPGIIRHTEDDDSKLVQLILETVDHYISKKNAIIIATITCKDDVENQEIVKKARDHDKEGIRTLGVLTKPDTIEPGCYEKYFKIIRGHSHPLRLGYYAVRNLTQAELLKGDKSARKFESSFFQSLHWKDLPQERLGVPNLTRQLSNLLIAAIKRQLPGIKKEVVIKLREVTDRLNSLPPPSSGQPRFEANKLVGAFVRRVESAMEVETSNMHLWHQIQPHIQKFCKRIRETRPNFKIDTAANANDPNDGLILSRTITRENISELIQTYRGRQIDGIIPYQAFRKLVAECQKDWAHPAIACLSGIADEFLEYLDAEIRVIFAPYPLLASKISNTVRQLHGELHMAARARLEDMIIPMEIKLPPYTWNQHYLISNRDHFRKQPVQISQTETSFNRRYPQPVAPPIAPHDDIRELAAMIRAYIKVSHKRFSDNVPLTIDLVFLHKFTEQLHDHLAKHLGLVDRKEDVDLEVLMEEDKEIATERKILSAKHECFTKALEELDRFL